MNHTHITERHPELDSGSHPITIVYNKKRILISRILK